MRLAIKCNLIPLPDFVIVSENCNNEKNNNDGTKAKEVGIERRIPFILFYLNVCELIFPLSSETFAKEEKNIVCFFVS